MLRRRHQGRHRFQTSDALGAAGCMLGPRAVALATELIKELGLSPRKTAQALARLGIRVSPGGVVQAVARQARRLELTCRALVEGVRASRILGGDHAGVLERDGWAPYRRIAHAKHQTGTAHLLRRTGEMIDDSIAGQARVPHAARRILKDALELRDQRAENVIDADEFDLKVRDLKRQTDALLKMRSTHEPNRRLLGHLRNEQEHLFTFLTQPGALATHWRAEQAFRPAIVNRRNWGGNRTTNGAQTQQTVISVIRTARQQNLDPLEVMTAAQPDPVVSELIKLPARASPSPTAIAA